MSKDDRHVWVMPRWCRVLFVFLTFPLLMLTMDWGNTEEGTCYQRLLWLICTTIGWLVFFAGGDTVAFWVAAGLHFFGSLNCLVAYLCGRAYVVPVGMVQGKEP